MNTQIKTDNGVFFDQTETKVVNQFTGTRMDVDLSSADPSEKYAMTFESPKITDVYSRRYLKLQDLFGNLGGLLNIILILGKAACSYISKTSLYIKEAKEQAFFREDDSIEHNLKTEKEHKDSEVQIIPFETLKNKETDNSSSNVKGTSGGGHQQSLFSEKPRLIIKENHANYDTAK